MVALVGDKIKPQNLSVINSESLRQKAQNKLLELYALCKTLARVEPLKDHPILEPPDEPSA